MTALEMVRAIGGDRVEVEGVDCVREVVGGREEEEEVSFFFLFIVLLFII